MIKKLSIIFVLVIAIIILFNNLLMPLYVKHSSLVKVPQVVGMSYNDAKKTLEESGLDVKQGDIRYDESKPIGLVLDQNPPAEQMVKKGRRIYLIVCGGEQLMEVPKLTGRTLRDAKFALEQRNLILGEVVKKFSNDVPEDVVISQIIQPGSKVKKNTKIDLILSNGPQIGDIIVPNLIGKTLDEAKKILTDKKLKLGKVTYQASDLPSGQVIEQYPQKDKSAKENTVVDVFIAKKKKVVETPIEEIPSSEENNNKKKIDAEKSKEIEKDNKDKLENKEKPIDKQDKQEKQKSDTKNIPKEKEKHKDNKDVKEPKDKQKDTKEKSKDNEIKPKN